MTFASYFREAANDMADAIDDTMGEVVLVTPCLSKPNYPAAPDSSSPPYTVTMVFTHKAQLAFSKKGEPSSGNREFDLTLPIQTRKPKFSVKACNLPSELRQGFRIQRCFDQTMWEITNLKPDGISRIDIEIVQLGRASQLERPVR